MFDIIADFLKVTASHNIYFYELNIMAECVVVFFIQPTIIFQKTISLEEKFLMNIQIEITFQ